VVQRKSCAALTGVAPQAMQRSWGLLIKRIVYARAVPSCALDGFISIVFIAGTRRFRSSSRREGD
jgi:hypothetical protein